MAGFSQGLLGDNVLTFLGGGETISKLFTEWLSDDKLQNPLMNLLAQAETDYNLQAFLQNPLTENILTNAKQMGEGASQQIFNDLGNAAYREWLLRYPPEPHPNLRGIPKWNAIQASGPESATKKVCQKCGTFYEEKDILNGACSNCLSTEFDYLVNEMNPEWTEQLHKHEEWKSKSEEQKHKLGIVNTDDIGAKQIGAILTTVAGGALGGITLGDFIGSLSKGSDTTQRAHEDAKLILSRKTESQHTVDKIDNFRYGEELSPQEALYELEFHLENTRLNVAKFDVFPGNIMAQDIHLSTGGTIKGTVVCLGKFWAKGIINMKIEGDLVIMGSLEGVQVPNVSGSIFLVQDDEIGVHARVSQPNTLVTVCTIDRAHQIAKEAGLLNVSKKNID